MHTIKYTFSPVQLDSHLFYLHKHLFECFWSCTTPNIHLISYKKSQGCSAIHRITPWINWMQSKIKFDIWHSLLESFYPCVFPPSFPNSDHAPTNVETAFRVNRTRLCQATTEVFKMSGYLIAIHSGADLSAMKMVFLVLMDS